MDRDLKGRIARTLDQLHGCERQLLEEALGAMGRDDRRAHACAMALQTVARDAGQLARAIVLVTVHGTEETLLALERIVNECEGRVYLRGA
ncbi:MAG: hypothetical protein H0V89_05720 [Deltaproteobacteria bacterium]|nr:hypothetical protein [Deltaproteobacteria bacterium]